MKEVVMEISDKVKSHLERLFDKNAFGSELSLNELLDNWSKKEALLTGQIQNLKMEDINHIEDNCQQGILGISYSGSLLAIYAPVNGKRKMEYASIKMRSDVPDIINDENVILDGAVSVDKPVRFSKGKLEHSSPLYRIAVTSSDLSVDEQNKRLSEAMIYLSNGFLKLNHDTYHPQGDGPEHFSKRNMVAYIAKKYGLTQQITREMVDDFFTLMETGVLMGESLSLGRMGRLKIKKKNAQKARVLKSPLDGSEIMVPAKPASMVPKISFSDYFKDRVSSLPVEE